jgi:hypothetical protein
MTVMSRGAKKSSIALKDVTVKRVNYSTLVR